MRLPGIEEKYEILRTLGEGGMGVVYLALQKRIDRKVAIKAIAPYLARDPAVRQRFAAEAAVLARLNHPNIVTLYDYIEEENALYLIMEYVEGQSLSDLLKAGPLPLELIEKYFLQVLEAFRYAHEQGIIHRDIKPANIMVASGGRIKILDFGVARLLQTDHSLTRTGMRLGTLLYMSPEQVKGEREVDARSDIYSLGVVLYEMLTGKPPYPVDLGEFDLSLKIVKEPLFDLSRPPAEIPGRLVEVILKATEKEPSYRYPSCEIFLREFEQSFQPHAVMHAPPTQVVVPPARPRSRWPLWGALISIVLLLALFLWWLRWDSPFFSSSFPSDTTHTLLDSVPSYSRWDTMSSTWETLASASTPTPPHNTANSPSLNSPSDGQQKTPTLRSTKNPPKSSNHNKNTSSTSSPVVDTTPSSPSSISPLTLLKAEVLNFRRTSPLQTKATLQVHNESSHSFSSVRIVVYLLNRVGETKRTDTLSVSLIEGKQTWSKPLQYMVAGVHGMRAEIISAEP
ncbi:MAG: serine/threonine protein kinase [Bacteroidia bacterium]|nr:serine/threonine protein kinase [Bacteroidia bacterium]